MNFNNIFLMLSFAFWIKDVCGQSNSTTAASTTSSSTPNPTASSSTPTSTSAPTTGATSPIPTLSSEILNQIVNAILAQLRNTTTGTTGTTPLTTTPCPTTKPSIYYSPNRPQHNYYYSFTNMKSRLRPNRW